MITNSINNDDKSSSFNKRGKKRKLAFREGEVAPKKPKTAPTQQISISQSCEESVALQKIQHVTLLKKRVPESKGEGTASKKPKAVPLLTKRVRESSNATVVLQEQKASTMLIKRIPKSKTRIGSSIEQKASPVPKVKILELKDADVASKKLKSNSTLENSMPEPKDIEIAMEKPRNTHPSTNLIPRTTTKRSATFQNPASALYGDMVSLLSCSVLIPKFGYDFYQMEVYDPKRSAAIEIYMAMVLGTGMLLMALLFKNVWFSRLGMAAAVVFNSLANIKQWPDAGECTITVLFQGGVLMAVLANISLSFHEKLIRLAVFFIVGSYVSIQSPYSVYLEDTFPILGVTILVAIFVLYIYHFGVNPTLATVQGARLILGAVFVHHVAVCLADSNDSLYHNITQLVKGALVVSVGVVAAGSFQNEILQRERLEILVRKRTQKLHMVNMALQASETAIAITDRQGYIVWLNAAFERLSGGKAEGLLRRGLKEVIYQLDTTSKDNRYVLMESYDDPFKSSEGELKIGESYFQLETTPFASEGDNGDDIPATNDRFLMVFKDVTAGRARQVAEKKAEYEATMAKAMGESMVTLTHELRTPLQGIMGVTSLLLQQVGDLADEAIESLKLIMGSSILLLNLINNLLDVKKANAKMMEEFPLTAISASDPIKDAVCFCLPLASISKVNIMTDLRTDENAIVTSNSLRLQQVLINLVSNAIKYTKRGSDIRVHIRATTLVDARKMIDGAIASSWNDKNEGNDNESSVLVFSVSDCGPGIAPDQASRLFRRYATLDNKPKRTLGSNDVGQPSGTGLGLHLCQLFVERMNGCIWATNNGNDVGGSTFSFYLPLVSNGAYGTVQDQVMSNRSQVSNCHSSNNNERLGIKKKKANAFDMRVLLVDDTLINRKVILRMLKKIGISNSVTVESGEKALEELSINPYDLVITDLQMPGMSGTELSEAIRDTHNGSTAPIVVGLTADTSPGNAEQCLKSGMADLIYKPITLSEMKEYFETTVPKLKRGIWYNGGCDVVTSTPAQ